MSFKEHFILVVSEMNPGSSAIAMETVSLLNP